MALSYRLPERLRVGDHEFSSTSVRFFPLADSQGLRRGGFRTALFHRVVLAYVNQMFQQIFQHQFDHLPRCYHLRDYDRHGWPNVSYPGCLQWYGVLPPLVDPYICH